MSTELALRHLTPALPEWRRSGPFLLLAVALHGALLAAPLRRPPGELDIPPPPLSVTLVQAPEPLPVAAPKPQALRPTAAPAAPAPARERPQPRPTAVLAMSPEQQPVAAASTTVASPAPIADTAPRAAAPVAAAAGPAVSAARFDAAYLQNPKPNYPALSRRLGEEGKVLLKVRVGSDGKPIAVELEKSSDFERLDNAARQVVQNWRFVPAKRGDEAIEASVIVPIVFRLDS